MVVESVAIGAAGLGLVSDVADGGNWDEKCYAKLCQIERTLQALNSYPDLVRWGPKVRGRGQVSYTAGVRSNDIPFIAPSSMMVQSITIHAYYVAATGAAGAGVYGYLLLGGSREMPMLLVTNSTVGGATPFDFHLNGGQSVSFEYLEGVPAQTVEIRWTVSGYLEQNRLGPIRDLGENP